MFHNFYPSNRDKNNLLTVTKVHTFTYGLKQCTLLPLYTALTHFCCFCYKLSLVESLNCYECLYGSIGKINDNHLLQFSFVFYFSILSCILPASLFDFCGFSQDLFLFGVAARSLYFSCQCCYFLVLLLLVATNKYKTKKKIKKYAYAHCNMHFFFPLIEIKLEYV